MSINTTMNTTTNDSELDESMLSVNPRALLVMDNERPVGQVPDGLAEGNPTLIRYNEVVGDIISPALASEFAKVRCFALQRLSPGKNHQQPDVCV